MAKRYTGCLALILIVWIASSTVLPSRLVAESGVSADVIGAAGGEVAGPTYRVGGTLGQAIIGTDATGATVALKDGFWASVRRVPSVAVDTIPPAAVSNFEVVPLDTAISLSWMNPKDSDFAGTLIRYSTDSFPSTPEDGLPVENGKDGVFYNMPGSTDEFIHTGLTNGVTYYYTAFAFDISENYAVGVSDSATPFDSIPPAPVTFEAITALDTTIILRWTNPSDPDFDHTVICYSTTSFPLTPTEGVPVENGNNGIFPNSPASVDSFIHTGLTNGTTYYYSAFAADEVPNYSSPATVSGSPGDFVPPSPVSTFQAVAVGDGTIRLRWVNPPEDDFVGCLIRYSTSGYPDSVTSGFPAENGNDGKFPGEPAVADSFLHTHLTAGLTDYYSIFAYDEVPNYSPGVTSEVTCIDSVVPELTLSIFQNPYVTNHLDIYLVSSEVLADTSVYCEIAGDQVEIALSDTSQNVWRADYDLYSTGILEVYARGRDRALNIAEITREFSSSLILATIGGRAVSVDDRCQIEFAGGSITDDAYVLIFNRADLPNVNVAYHISPSALPITGYIKLTMRYDAEIEEPEHLCIVEFRDGVTSPIESYLDYDSGCVIAYVNHLGTYGLVWRSDIETPVYSGEKLVVLQNVPNPFGSVTQITFILPRAGHVAAQVISVDGRKIKELLADTLPPGKHTIIWDGLDADGKKAASGVYFYRIRFESESVTKKMVYLR